GSFSRAADALSLTQPTVSEHVRALEDELGVPLLDRLGRGAAPTHAGRLLLGYARRLLALQREAQQALDQFQGRMSGELVVGGATSPGEYVLPALIGRFKGKYPDISICLRIGSSRQVTAWVEEGLAEVGVVGAPPGPKTLRARDLMADELVVVVPAGHAWANRNSVTLADVQREPLIVREPGSGHREGLARALDQVNPVPAAGRRGLRSVRRIGGPGGHVLRPRWRSTPTRRSGSPRTPPAPAVRPRWLLEISRRCSRLSSPWVARSPTCSSAWARPTTPRSIASPPTWRSSRRWTSFPPCC